jgi:DNA polymerase-3 subunit epsilon
METRALPKAVDRATAVAWARAVTSLSDVLFLDTETTGLGKTAEIVDLSIVALDGTVVVNQLVKPTRPIPIDAVLIHGITNQHVAAAPSWPEVLEAVRPLLHGRLVIAYNSSFDRSMVEQCTAAVRLECPPIEWQCAMRAYAAYRKDPRLPSAGYRWRPLHEAAESCGLPVPTHRALADAVACRGVVLRMATG